MAAFDTAKFIAEVKNRPSIWDRSSDEHADRNIRKCSWEEIVEIFSEDNDMTTVGKRELEAELQRKWKGIRGCYTRELNRQIALKAGLDLGPRKSEYIYFKQLYFLKNSVSLKEPMVETENPEELHRPKRIKRESSISDLEEDQPPIFVDVPKFEGVGTIDGIAEQDEDKMFLLSLLSTLQRVPGHKKMATKIKIMALLDEVTQDTFA